MIHGFMGTPAEMRPLANELHQAGWTVQGLLLPGFGAEIETLFQRRYQEWVEAASSALTELKEQHRPVLLAGYSMGGAVALNVAADNPPDGLILLAPFWRMRNALHRTGWQIVKRLLSHPRPFKRADFTKPRIHELFGGLLPGLDLNDPQVQDTLRELRVPISFLDQVITVGRSAGKVAQKVQSPTLIIQGLDDEAVRPAASRQLRQKLSVPVHYQELQTDHKLLDTDNPQFAELIKAVLAFAGAV